MANKIKLEAIETKAEKLNDGDQRISKVGQFHKKQKTVPFKSRAEVVFVMFEIKSCIVERKKGRLQKSTKATVLL